MVLRHNIHIKLQKERKYVVFASKNIIQVYMKTNLNKAMAKTRIDEISLFKKISYLLNNSVSQCTYVNNIHGKIYVEYPSNISNTIKRVELGDLWIFIYDKAKKF